MASIKERIKAALFSNRTLAVAWGLALFANTALVAMGLVDKDVPGAVAAMLGAIAAALMIFSIFLREKADAEDEDETADDGESETIVEELLAEAEAEPAAQASSESSDESESADGESETESEAASEESENETESDSSTAGSAKSGEARAAEEEA